MSDIHDCDECAERHRLKQERIPDGSGERVDVAEVASSLTAQA